MTDKPKRITEVIVNAFRLKEGRQLTIQQLAVAPGIHHVETNEALAQLEHQKSHDSKKYEHNVSFY